MLKNVMAEMLSGVFDQAISAVPTLAGVRQLQSWKAGLDKYRDFSLVLAKQPNVTPAPRLVNPHTTLWHKHLTTANDLGMFRTTGKT
jgi:hypothetical protein